MAEVTEVRSTEEPPSPRPGGLFSKPYLFATLLVLIGLTLCWGGARLLTLGGSPYYILAGLLTVASGVLVGLGRRLGGLLFGVLLIGSVAWAIGEVGFDAWALAARLMAPMVLGLWFLFPWTARRLGPPSARPASVRAAIACVVLVAAVGFGAIVHYALVPDRADPMYQAGQEDHPASGGPVAAAGSQSTDWQTWGGDAAGTRFSALSQITPANAGKLAVAWTFHFGKAPDDAPQSLEGTPLKIGDTLYACSDYNDVVALNAETGQQRWRFRAHTDNRNATYAHCRGVAYYRVPEAQGVCAERIYTNTIDARLLAIDAASGKPCAGFGVNGVVDLKIGQPKAPPGYYYITSAPTISRGRIVLGGWVSDGMYWGEPSGVIRAFDANTGALSWAFDLGHPDRRQLPPSGQTYTSATPNSWAPMSADDQLGLVYAPLGGATPDNTALRRRPFDEAYSSSVVALDVETGQPRWKFQTVHHDLWDYDAASQPTLVDLPTSTGLRKALIQPTKRGEIFVLDRATGKPIYPVTEHRVPQDGLAPHEWAAPTQPFSDALPSFRGKNISERDMWGVTPLDQMWCRIAFRQARYEGPLTLPGLTPSIQFPGFLGGMNWGGVSIDRDHNVMIVNSNYVANYVQLIPRGQADRLGVRPVGMGGQPTPEGRMILPQFGLPVAARSLPFLSPLFAPCQAPPWGRISAVDLASGKLLWSHPIGTARDSGPLGLPSLLPFKIGTPNLGGSVTTRGGVTFIAATQDKYLRAIDTKTGSVLWRGRLAQAGQSTPMTYLSRASGRQFVVTASGGHALLGTKPGDAIVAFAIPKGQN
ncbi:glucose/quinate/shikimate family membrane-bound PQQ-dependent dehydrogenase [Sphingomonas oligophenolica]|uniref:Membrane-bound PQQ-dependent dehydrogenase, glucose/quinate/shikimate family n=1 Tax=Sphingomonas oligophenolica TaxID=301154 RepID=A0ABU9YCY1_9SPHN